MARPANLSHAILCVGYGFPQDRCQQAANCMSYDLHITRRRDWSKPGKEISVEEWLAYVEKDTDLVLWAANGPHMAKWSGQPEYPDAWLDWFQGNIYTKNPNAALIDKMVQIADALGARVQGDDGEIYRNGHDAPDYPKASAFERLRNWLRVRNSTPAAKPIKPAFQVGDRVLDVYGKTATVAEIDPKSNRNLGKVTVRYDDGRELSFMLAASGLKLAEHPQKTERA